MKPGRKIASFVILSLVGVVLVTLFRPQRINSEFETSYFWTYKTHTYDTYDVLFYGDSRVYRGISPDVVLEGTDLSGFNFGFSSGSMSAQMMDFLETRLDRSVQPMIVLGITPHSFTLESLKDEHYLQELNRPPYAVFQRYYIDRWLKVFDRITPEELLGYRDWVTHEWCGSDGWMMSDNDNVDEFGALDHYEKILTNNPIDSANYQAFFDRIAKWNTEGIKVFAYRPPTTPEMEELENDKTGFDEQAFILRFEKCGGKWLNLDKSEYRTYDGSHLRENEVIRLSEEINLLMGIE